MPLKISHCVQVVCGDAYEAGQQDLPLVLGLPASYSKAS